jgi:hypothetical protein
MEIRRAQNKEIVGTSVQGRIHYSFDQIVDLLGAPHHLYEDSEKTVPPRTRCEWDIVLNGEPISIYDHCEYEKSVKEVDCWHIGGRSVKAVQLFMEFISSYFDDVAVHDFYK